MGVIAPSAAAAENQSFKKFILIIAVSVLGLTLLAQEISHQAVVINVEVPVRVFKGNEFVDDLTRTISRSTRMENCRK